MPVAAKVCKNAFAAESRRFAKTKSTNQRKIGFLPYAIRRQLGGFLLSQSKCKRCTAIHIFSLADVCGCRGVGFMLFFGFCSLFCSLHITLSKELIFIFSCHLVCDLSTASRCHAHPKEIRVSGAEALRIFAFLSVAQRAKERKSFAFP